MRKYILIIFVCCFSIATWSQAQEVKFLSSGVEEGVREHLNMDDGGTIALEQLDTITTIDLSRRGITDIHDLMLMPNLREVDLNNNKVDDIYPLTMLDSLEWVDLSYNNLRGVSELIFSSSKKMTVNVGFNYIKDFSVFGLMMPCDFTFEGTGLQFEDNPQFFQVSQLFCDASVSPAVLYVNLSTNMPEVPKAVYGKNQFDIPVGTFYKQSFKVDSKVTSPVFVTNGIKTDSTFVVPVKTVKLNKLEEVVIETGLPGNLDISAPKCSQGTLVVDNQTLRYTASADFKNEEVVYNFSLCGMLRGIAKIILTSEDGQLLPGDVNEDTKVDISDIVAVINQIAGTGTYRYADVNGDTKVDISDIVAIINIIAGQ